MAYCMRWALVRLAKGDREAARQALEQTLKTADKITPGYLGASVEMERLRADESKLKP